MKKRPTIENERQITNWSDLILFIYGWEEPSGDEGLYCWMKYHGVPVHMSPLEETGFRMIDDGDHSVDVFYPLTPSDLELELIYLIY